MVPWSLRPHQALESLLLFYETAPEQSTLSGYVSLEPLVFCFVVMSQVISILSSCMRLSSMTDIWTSKHPLFRPAHSALLPIKWLLPCHVAYMSGRLSLLPGLNMCMKILNSSQFACEAKTSAPYVCLLQKPIILQFMQPLCIRRFS